MIRSAALAVATLFAASIPAMAQDAPAMSERVVRGIIVDSISGRPLGGVAMYFDGRRDEFYSGSEGEFRIAGVHRRDSVLVVRRIGFVPLRVGIPKVESPLAIDLGSLHLRPVATKLDQIAVEAEEVERYPLLAAFYRRKQNSVGGTFITRQDIDRSASRRTSEVLRRVVKIEMDCTNDRFGDDNCLARNRRGRIIRPQAVSSGTRRNGVIVQDDTATMDRGVDRCEMELYVDGMRSTLKVDEVPLSWIGGIEVYSGLATTPADLGSGRCGVIAIWTTNTVGS